MKKTKYIVIAFIIITFSMISCAPSPENAHHAINGHNYLVLGAYHGFISPLAVFGKILGLNIGIYDAGKNVFSYWLGYIFALYLYLRIIVFAWHEIRTYKKGL